MKIILYISKKHKYEVLWKSELMAAYHFGHKIFNSAPFFFKISANEAYLQGVSTPALNRFQPVFISPVWCGFYWFFYLKRLNCNWFGLVFFGLVRSGFGLFPVHWTEPSNTSLIKYLEPSICTFNILMAQTMRLDVSFGPVFVLAALFVPLKCQYFTLPHVS